MTTEGLAERERERARWREMERRQYRPGRTIPRVEPSERTIPKKPYGFRGDWPEYLKGYFRGDEEKYQAFLRGGQGLAGYLRGRRFGSETASQLGLEYGYGYQPEELKPWFDRLKEYSAYFYNYPIGIEQRAKPLSYWVRGAQLGLSPQAYVALEERLRTGGRELSDVEKYLFGITDVSPSGYKSIPAGETPTMYPGEGEPTPVSRSEEWFRQRYPSISGGERGGTRRTGFGWRQIFTGSGRFAPKVKTIEF